MVILPKLISKVNRNEEARDLLSQASALSRKTSQLVALPHLDYSGENDSAFSALQKASRFATRRPNPNRTWQALS